MEERKYDVEAVRNRLNEYRESFRDIEAQNQRLIQLEARMEGLGAQVISDMPRSPSKPNDVLTDLIAQKEEIEEDLRDVLAEQKMCRRIIEKVLKHVRKTNQKTVIRLRYIDCSEWNDVAFSMYGNREDFLDKEDTYIRRAHRLHGAALVSMAAYVEDSGDPDMAFFKADV